METSSPSAVSPRRRSNEGSKSENAPPQGRGPHQQSVTSASRLPASPLRVPISPQVASARYVKQFQALMEHQRQTFDEERALWSVERTELHEKIAQLEGSLYRYQTISSSQASSPINNSKRGSQSNSSFWSLLSKDGSSHTSGTTTGDEIWRGPKLDVQPTRTFSDPTTQSTKPGDRGRLPSIAEDTTCGRKDSLDMQPGLHKPSVSSAEIDKNLDGINFKSSTLSPVPIKQVMTPQSPSSRTSSPSRLSPRTIQLPSSKLEAPLDPYTKDAGHTPLVRRTYFNADFPSGEGDGPTPTQPEIERPPLEPHVSSAKLPSERSDSYFPVAEDESWDERDRSRDGEDKSPDEDPELKEPLGLDNSKGEDKHFLGELDSKLLQAARSEAFSPSGTGSGRESSLDKDEKDFEQPEHEPKLRIKRSTNFGNN
ncbi:hypothetical protein HO173_002374 [Letharia columbiana]|uniref:Uncharacterized protein n=1 Tax=Letharia columbiana TaxID=112416 RepID=A0A8H6L8P0_9LECA|nr:uncharacterized protein HO173_002374 [Letharia columbiana]KAF6239828.1 hypothetical protein HO173_002374 [Letharia columbiana]